MENKKDKGEVEACEKRDPAKASSIQDAKEATALLLALLDLKKKMPLESERYGNPKCRIQANDCWSTQRRVVIEADIVDSRYKYPERIEIELTESEALDLSLQIINAVTSARK